MVLCYSLDAIQQEIFSRVFAFNIARLKPPFRPSISPFLSPIHSYVILTLFHQLLQTRRAYEFR